MIVASLIFTFFISLYLLFYFLNDYQKQYYDISRFIKLTKQKIKFSWKKLGCFFFLAAISFLPVLFKYMDIIQYFLIYVLAFLLYRKKINDKVVPFKMTKRVKRFVLEYTITYALFAFLMLLLHCPAKWITIIYFILIYWIFILTGLYHHLIEKIINKKYKKQALRKIAKCKHLKIIGITGSYGKTSTKHYLHHLLNGSFNVLTTPKSYNTFNGILMTINESLNFSHEILILEIGIDKVNGMNKFIQTFDFDVAAVTSIGPQHLATFKSIENIEKEKMKLPLSVKENRGVIINLDEPSITKYQDKIKTNQITISSQKNADIYASHLSIKLSGITFKLHIDDESYLVKTHVIGRHHINNMLIAVAIAKYLGISNEKIVDRLKTMKNVQHRLEYKKEGNWVVIDDAYNSNLKGFIEALATLKMASTKRILITPGIIELNKQNLEMNQELAKHIKKSADYVYLVGNNAKSIYNQLILEQMNDQKIKLYDGFQEAMDEVKQQFQNQKITILIENDLPDTYLK